MRMNEISFEGQPPVDGYGPGGFRIAGAWTEGSVVITPGRRVSFAGPLDAAALEPVIEAADQMDLVLIGQGPEMAPLDPALREMIEAAGIGVEHMSTPSACRTYNVLLAEHRRVSAVLLAL